MVSTGSFPNARLEIEKVRVALLTPVPVRFTLCGLPAASSVMVTAAVRVPLALGVKVTLIVQLEPAATLDAQLLVCAKSLPFVPVMAILVMLSVALPLLVRVRA